MRRLALGLAFFVFVCLRAHAVDIYDCYNGSSEQGGNRLTVNGIQTNQYAQQSYPTTTTTVYLHNTLTLATIWKDAAGTISLANPFSSTSHGVAFFCGADGRYDIQYSGTTITTPFTVSDIHLCFSCSGGGGGTVGPGTINQVAKFTTTTNVGDSSGSDNGVNPVTWPLGLSVQVNADYHLFVNSPSGTTTNLLICTDASVTTVAEVTTCPTSTTKALAIADVGAGTTGNVQGAILGLHACVFDNQTTINDYVIPSTTVAGECSDSAARPAGSQGIGRVISLNGGAGTLATVEVGPWDLFAPSSSGGSGTVSNCGSAFSNAYYASIGTIVGCDTFSTDDGAGNVTDKSVGLTNALYSGFYYITQGPLPPPVPVNSIMHYVPTSVTAYSERDPGVAGTTSQVKEVLSTTTDTNGNTIDLMGWVTLGAGTGTVTSFSAGTLSPIFTTSVATATTTPALSFILTNASANTVLAGPTSGGASSPTYRSLVTADLPAVTLRRVCSIVIGADNGSVLVNADIAPQLEQCQIPYAATVQEVDVNADAGTPNVVVTVRHCTANPCASNFTVTDLLSTALATAASGGPACSKTGATAGLDTFTTCSATLQNTTVAIGDYIETHTATAGGTAHRMSIMVYFTVN